jgi:hypothetical protein
MGIAINNKQVMRMQRFDLGQNSSDEPSVVTNGFAGLLENHLITNAGKVEQRGGLERVGDETDELKLSLNFNDSTVADVVGSNTVTSASVSIADGKFGKGVKFNGSGSSITVAAASAISVNTMGPFRFSAWIKGTSGTICNKLSTGAGFKIHIASSEINFEVGYSTTNAKIITTSAAISASSFYKLDCIMNTDKSLDVFINGAIQTYGTDTQGVGTANNDTAVAMAIGTDSSLYMDDVRLYDGSYAANQLDMNKITGMTHYKVGNTIDNVYRVSGTKLERLDADYSDWTIVTGCSAIFTDGADIEFLQAKDILFMFEGGQNCQSLSSAEALTDEGNGNGDVPQGSTAEWMPNNRMFVAGVPTDADRDTVYFSDSFDPQTFVRDTNIFRAAAGTNDKVTKLKRWRNDELVIYKENSIFVLSNTNGAEPLTDWSLKIYNPNIGCKAPRSVVSLGDEQIFLADDGIRLLSRTEFDQVKNAVISKPVNDIIQRINRDSISKACAYFYDNKYIIFFPIDSSTENNCGLIYDTQAIAHTGNVLSGWSIIPMDIWFPSCFETYEFSDNTLALLYGDNRSLSTVYRAFKGNTDDGATISSKFNGPMHSVDYVREAVWSPINIVCDSDDDTEVLVSASVDSGAFEQLGIMDVDTGVGINLPVNLPFSFAIGVGKATKVFHPKKLGRAKTFQLQVLHNSYNKSFILNEYSLYASVKG